MISNFNNMFGNDWTFINLVIRLVYGVRLMWFPSIKLIFRISHKTRGKETNTHNFDWESR